MSEAAAGSGGDAGTNGAAAPQGVTEPQKFARVEEAPYADLVNFINKPKEEGDTTAPSDDGADAGDEGDVGAAPAKPNEPPKGDPSDDEFVRVPKKEYERDKRRLDESQSFIKRRSAELGEAKKSITALQTELRDRIKEKSLDSPAEAMKDTISLHETEKQLAAVEQEENALHWTERTKATFEKFVPSGEMNLDDMAISLQSDEIPIETIQRFKANPYGMTTPDALVHLHKRAKAESLLRRVLPSYQALIKENEELKARPSEVVRKINDNRQRMPATINGKSGGGSASAEGASFDSIPLMTTEQINEILARGAKA